MVSTAVFGHSGGTDSSGGHYNRKTGVYHFHGTPKTRSPVSAGSFSLPAPSPETGRGALQGRSSGLLLPNVPISESDWHTAFNAQVTKGRNEVVLPTGRIDILTDKYAVEVDRVSNYRAGIKQALQYAGATRKKPGLALYMDGSKDTLQALDEARRLCKRSEIRFWLINAHISVNDLVSRKARAMSSSAFPSSSGSLNPGSDPNRERTALKSYWLNTQSGVRHNRSCRWYANTKSGRSCSGNEGRGCRQCGG